MRLARSIVPTYLPVAQHADAIAQSKDFGHAMRNVNHRHAARLGAARSARRGAATSGSERELVGSSKTRMRRVGPDSRSDLHELLLRGRERAHRLGARRAQRRSAPSSAGRARASGPGSTGIQTDADTVPCTSFPRRTDPGRTRAPDAPCPRPRAAHPAARRKSRATPSITSRPESAR